ncbi:MAG: GatB/YqeY domain-containing protein [Saprospiraceae bacterium]|nr:GatB/YqeY domain-containing protein [Saprospiraceae bacterium]
MSLEVKINEAIIAGMKAQDKATLRALRGIKSAIMLVKTDGSGVVIDEAKEIQILQKLLKQRKDSLEIYVKQNREDLAVIEREEIAVIEKYLPQALSSEEIEENIKQIIKETGAESMKDMGKVMGLAGKSMAGQADGKLISEIVKKLLA